MKEGFRFSILPVSVIAILFVQTDTKADSFPLVLRSSGPQVQLLWPTTITNGGQGFAFPEYEVQYSTDLVQWKPIGGRVRGIDGLSGPTLQLSLDPQPGPIFYRISADPSST